MLLATRRRTQAAPDLAAASDLLALLRGVAADPSPVAVQVAADWLDDHLPARRVPDEKVGRLPGWFIRGWRQNATRPGRRGGGRNIANEVRVAFDPRSLLDHWGTDHVHGIAALVSEPYCDDRDTAAVADHLARVAARCGGVGVFSRKSAWFPPHTWRLMWFPHPDRLAEQLARGGNKTYRGW